MNAAVAATGATSSSHDAVLFHDDATFVAAAVPHLRAGIAAGEQVVVACAERHRRLLQPALQGAREPLVLDDDAYGDPVGAVQLYVDLTRRAVAAGGAGLRVVGELPANATWHPRLWPRWSRYEAVVNEALAMLPFHVLCAYDDRTSAPEVLDDVRRTHPRLAEPFLAANADYLDPAACLRRFGDPDVLAVESTTPMLEVHGIRGPAAAHQARIGLSRLLAHLDTALVPHAQHLPPADPTMVETADYLVAVDELLDNALAHGRPPVALRTWVVHDQVVTVVSDRGEGFADPFAGYVVGESPGVLDGPDVTGGRRPRSGLWRARQRSEELSYRHGADGFTVRLRADLDVRAP